MLCMSRWVAYGLLGAVSIASPSHAQDTLVANGSFASDADSDGEPDHWTTSGVAGMEQTLVIAAGPDGTKAGCPSPAILCNPFGWWDRQVGPPIWGI